MGCAKCGNCCQRFNCTVPFHEGGGEARGMISKMLSNYPIKFKGEIMIGMFIQAECINYDPVNKRCVDYENRPKLCRDYYCEGAK